MKKLLSSILFCLALISSANSNNETNSTAFGWGRYFPQKFKEDNKTFTLSLTKGYFPKFNGEVIETKRASRDYNANRSDYANHLATYTFSDLGFDDTYSLIGLNLERSWKYLTLTFGGSTFSASSSATARETYGINVESVDYAGQEYENILIPEGQTFDSKLNGALINLGVNITPCYFSFGDIIHFTPWFHLGVFSIAGKFKIDAGEAQGVTTDYEYEPIEYVIGGQASGWFAAGFPEWGIGGEVVMEMATVGGFEYNLIFQANFAMMDYTGSTDDFGINARRAKDITLDYKNNEFGFFVEFPSFFKSANILIGLKYQLLNADASVNARPQSSEEAINLLQEKYDKDVSVDINIINGIISVQF